MTNEATDGVAPRATWIRLLLVDGLPLGLRIVEKSNWSGKAVVARRSESVLKKALDRKELKRPGVYVLTGFDDQDERYLYVGEADDVSRRLKEHARGQEAKDFWKDVIVFTSTNEGLNKAHARYLEAKLIGLAQSAGRWGLDNRKTPEEPPMSEADKADADLFLREMLVIFPLLAIDAFEEVRNRVPDSGVADQLVLKTKYAEGYGREDGDDFVVLNGSKARVSEVDSAPAHLRVERAGLTARKVLVPAGEHLEFTKDYRFESPSKAAGVLAGSNVNGLDYWKDEKGRTLGEIQRSRAQEDKESQ